MEIVILASADVSECHWIIAVASRVTMWQFCGGGANDECSVIQSLLNILDIAVVFGFLYYLRWHALLCWFGVCGC